MMRLGPKERDAVVLRFFENRTVREVASALGLREDARKNGSTVPRTSSAIISSGAASRFPPRAARFDWDSCRAGRAGGAGWKIAATAL